MKKIILCLAILTLTVTAYAQTLTASWYSVESLVKEGTRKQGEKPIMANGKEFKDDSMVCASRDYPLGIWLIVTNCNNNRSVIVQVTDRIGKRFKGKRIDLSKAAFNKIANLKQGIVQVEVKALD